jgi:hypothetical protein
MLDANHIARDPNERCPPLGEARMRQLHEANGLDSVNDDDRSPLVV